MRKCGSPFGSRLARPLPQCAETHLRPGPSASMGSLARRNQKERARGNQVHLWPRSCTTRPRVCPLRFICIALYLAALLNAAGLLPVPLHDPRRLISESLVLLSFSPTSSSKLESPLFPPFEFDLIGRRRQGPLSLAMAAGPPSPHRRQVIIFGLPLPLIKYTHSRCSPCLSGECVRFLRQASAKSTRNSPGSA